MTRSEIKNYPTQDNYDTEEEYEEALSAYWDNVDRKYDEWKDDKLMGDNQMKVGDKYKPKNKNSLCNYIVITKVLAQAVYYEYYEKG